MGKVLLIDDEQAVVHIVTRVLEVRGHDVIATNDGSRGFALAQRQHPALILLDLMMPVMDGFALLEALGRDPRTSAIPAVVLSSMISSTVEERCLALGARAVMQKPFEPEELIAIVESLLPPEGGSEGAGAG